MRSDGALRLSPPTDGEGTPDRVWYLGVNQVVAGGRGGSGIEKLELCFF